MNGILEIKKAGDWKYFHRVLHSVYANNPHYIFPLEKEVQNVFSPQENNRFKNGEACCYVLLENNRPLGRIAAFIDYEHNQNQPYPVGGIGFFECIDRKDYAFQLFSAVENYLKLKGMKAIDGPINFGERDRFWGLLHKGFDVLPLYQENYHPPYYRQFFEAWGFRPFEQILTFRGESKNIPFQRLSAIAKRAIDRSPIRVRPFRFAEVRDFARDFTIIYNASFQQFPHFHPLDPEEVANLMEKAKAIADPQLACLAYFDDQPAGFILLYPDINPLLKHAKGKLNAWTIPVFLLKNRMKTSFNAKGMGFGVHPDFQSKGIFAVLVDYLSSPRNLKRYPQMFLAGIRTQNHEIRSMYKKLKVEVDRVHVSYRKMLDDTLTFEPNEFIET